MIRDILFQLLTIHLWQAAPCTLHSVHYALDLQMHLHLQLYTHTTHWTLFTARHTLILNPNTFITSHWKHPTFAWVALMITMAKWTLIYINKYKSKSGIYYKHPLFSHGYPSNKDNYEHMTSITPLPRFLLLIRKMNLDCTFPL